MYTYSSGNLSSVQRTNSANASQTYSFTYDAFGNMTSLKVGSQTLATYTYGSGNGLLMSQTYANGDSVSFTYDNLGRTKTATYSDGRVLTYTYNGEGSLHSVTETNGNSTVTYLYTYDSIGRLISSEQKEGTSTTLRTNQNYNEYNQLTKQGWQMGSTAYSETYTYNASDGSLNTMTTGVGNTLTMGYDGLRRLSTVTGGPFNRSYSYRDISSTATTMQVSQLSYPNLGSGVSFGYTYDNLGNIATYTAPDGKVITYTYDNQGQLLSAAGDTTYTYTYDTVGNILTANGHTYTYGNANWKDLLTAFDGETITYDNSGNPISYYNGTRWAFTWNNGRSLTRAVSTTTAVDYTYDLSGLRTSKTVGDVIHNYLYAGSKLMRETYGSNTLDFFYDANGTPYALKYNGTVYYYVTNLQGDVIRVVDSNGNTVASYEYDPYGKVISTTGTLAEINPIRYRGYYYDTETGWYYLQSRYYDSEICRFINSDGYASTGLGIIGHNMFAYCNNKPTGYKDFGGNYPVAAAVDFLNTWLTGDGSKQNYSEGSSIVKALKKSDKMQEIIDEAISNYKSGERKTTGTGEFTAHKDGWELYLSTQHFDYQIDVVKETRTKGIWFWKHEEERYIAEVVVHDVYNFDSIRPWNSFGNILNNGAFILNVMGVGNDYEWYATYAYTTKWEKVV